jgi:putative ABC transport system permease protein
MLLILISFMISIPVSWMWMHEWLSTFAYHIDLSVLTFLFAGSLTVVIALLTITYQSIRVALVNPAKVLQNE